MNLFAKGTYVTTVNKCVFPWIGIVEETEENTVRCLFYDVDGAFRKNYPFHELRYYSVEEALRDVYSYYNAELPPVETYHFGEIFACIKEKSKELEEEISSIENGPRYICDPDYDDLTSAQLYELEKNREFLGLLSILKEQVTKEMNRHKGAY